MPPEPPIGGRRRAAAHFRALESLYRHAPGQRPVRIDASRSCEEGFARIRFEVREQLFHAAGAAHGTLYFKMMDDAAFYACNSLVSDRFLLTTAFNLNFTRPLRAGPAVAEGRWVSGRRRVFVGEARLIDVGGRGGGARHRHLHALAHPAFQPRRLRPASG